MYSASTPAARLADKRKLLTPSLVAGDCPAPRKRAATSVDVKVRVVDVSRKKRGALSVSAIRVTLTEDDATLQGVSSSISREAFNGQPVRGV